jgi:hypothetical protein
MGNLCNVISVGQGHPEWGGSKSTKLPDQYLKTENRKLRDDSLTNFVQYYNQAGATEMNDIGFFFFV